MKRSVRVLRRARRDLQEIYDFLAREAPGSADRVVDALFDVIESLETMSERGGRPRDPTLRASGYRFLVEGNHVVFYKIAGRHVRVYRVLHGARRYRVLL
ncbi:MAG: type II toxin-antitoxin system RelE/ParE family toxin [Deltaproteobacteria bacterium]|nr:type II toxin-antitoxin system RelE/ParE family toxin [Kofleriaceae bacterium]